MCFLQRYASHFNWSRWEVQRVEMNEKYHFVDLYIPCVQVLVTYRWQGFREETQQEGPGSTKKRRWDSL